MNNQLKDNLIYQKELGNLILKLKVYIRNTLVEADQIKNIRISLKEFEESNALPAIGNIELEDLINRSDLFIASNQGKEYLQEIFNCVQQIIDEEGKLAQNLTVTQIDNLLDKVTIRMHLNEMEKEKQEEEDRKQRMKKAVGDTMNEALKNIKPWKGLPSD